VQLGLAADGGWPPDLSAWQPTDWTALAACVTALIAVVAGTIALLQLRHARALRREQAQPYVVAYMQEAASHPQIVDLVVRNFGTTMAKDVKIAVTPPLLRSGKGTGSAPVWLPDCISALVPGQEWRTLWDFHPERARTDLPDRYEVKVSYTDSRGKALSTPAVLDWGAYKGRSWVTTYGIHHAAKSLREIEETAKKWTDSGGHLAVRTRDGDAADERERADSAAFIAQGDTELEQPEPLPGPGAAP